MPVGHPPHYKTPEELEEKLIEYFADCKDNENVPNILGMSLFLGFADTQSLIDQEKRGDQFSWIIKRYKSMAYESKYQAAIHGQLDKTIFIFDAVNNHNMFNTRTENKNDNDNKHSGSIDLSVYFVEPNGD